MRFDAEFLQFSVILGDVEAPILSSFGTNRVDKRALKIDAKSVKKGACGEREKKRHGGGGPLIRIQEIQESRLLRNKTLDQTRPGVPSGTVADIWECPFSCFPRPFSNNKTFT